MLYTPSGDAAARREAWYVPSMPASDSASQVSSVLNSAGNTQPAGDGDAVPTAMSIL